MSLLPMASPLVTSHARGKQGRQLYPTFGWLKPQLFLVCNEWLLVIMNSFLSGVTASSESLCLLAPLHLLSCSIADSCVLFFLSFLFSSSALFPILI